MPQTIVNQQSSLPQKLPLRVALRDALLKLRRGRLEPRKLALSIGVGVFIGMLPLPGLQTFVWLGLIALLPVDPILTYAFTWVSNPLTVLPFTFAELELGSLLATGSWQRVSLHDVHNLHAAARFGYHLGIGGLTFSVLSAAIAFIIAQALALLLWRSRSS